MKQVLQDARSGEITVTEGPAPQLRSWCVLVRIAASVVSVGNWACLCAVCAEESADDQSVANGNRLAVDAASFLNAENIQRESSLNE